MVGAILGMNKYCSANKCLDQLLNPSFTGNVCTAYGNRHEDDAQDSTLAYLRQTDPMAEINNCGLMLCTKPDMGWCGQSPDGLFGKYLVEYKCPYGQRGRLVVPDGPVDLYPRNTIPHAESLGDHAVPIPPYYFAQVQWGANLADLERILFVVWAPAGREVSLPFLGLAQGAVLEESPDPVRTVHERRIETTPDHYVVERLVATHHGLVQITDLPCDKHWFQWAYPRVHEFFTTRYVPAILKQRETCNNDDDEPDAKKIRPSA